MNPKRVVVDAPASSANLGSGFDVFAIALGEPRDRLALQKSRSGISLKVTGGARLPEAPEKNVAGAVAAAIMGDRGVGQGVSMTLTKGVPVGAGLGSSAASSVAAAVGMDALFGLKLSPQEIIRYAGLGEKLVSGAAHYDNVTASYAGGFVIVKEGFGHAKMKPPASMALCLVTPSVRLPQKKTEYARSLLPDKLSLETAAEVAKAASLIVHGFATGDLEEVGKGMMVSPVDEARAIMVPGFGQVKEAALAGGALGVCISGAGPTVLAVARRKSSSEVLKTMRAAFEAQGIECSGFVTEAGRGCSVVEG